MSLLDHLNAQINAIFTEHPYRFFTEHDIHSELARIATESLLKEGSLYEETKDNHKIGRVHHEYPTPFRCDMRGYEFRVITEDEFNTKRQQTPGVRARRGYFDLVILNQDFVSSNKLSVVSGKRYREVLSSLKDQRYPALDLAVEVVYHPTLDEKPHEGTMQRSVKSTVQDYKKLVELMNFKHPSGVPYCKQAGMLFFSNTSHKNRVNRMFDSFQEDKKVQLFKILYPM
jgi:hypothetical protein